MTVVGRFHNGCKLRTIAAVSLCSTGLLHTLFSPLTKIAQIRPISFNLATRSSTVSTLTPALRWGGSSTLRVFTRGVRSTPRSDGFIISIFFFLAFWERRWERGTINQPLSSFAGEFCFFWSFMTGCSWDEYQQKGLGGGSQCFRANLHLPFCYLSILLLNT